MATGRALDLVGTFVFALSGTVAGVKHRLDLFGVLVLSLAAATAGGMVRDVLVSEVPAVLRADLYAVAALAGASVVVIGNMLHFPSAVVDPSGVLLCFGQRLMAIRYRWQLPIARQD